MAKFRTKPVEIEAVQLTRDVIGAALFTGGALPTGVSFRGEVIPTEQRFIGNFVCASRQGEVSAEVDDWIVQEPGAEGFLSYPVKPDVFALKYEAIEG